VSPMPKIDKVHANYGFSYQVTKDHKVFISYEGKQVTTLTGKKANTFIANIQGATPEEVQLLMAKATGNFKRGNERSNA